jgi:excisionase family DNA binding protein
MLTLAVLQEGSLAAASSRWKKATMFKKTRAIRAGTSSLTRYSMSEKSARDGAGAPEVTSAADTALPDGPYVTVAEVAVILRVCRKSVRSRIKSGDLEAYRHGRRILIPLAAIERLIKSGRM